MDAIDGSIHPSMDGSHREAVEDGEDRALIDGDSASMRLMEGAVMPLRERLKATADKRHAAITASRQETVRKYNSDATVAAWTVDLIRHQSRGLHSILVPMGLITLMACSWTIYVVLKNDTDASYCPGNDEAGNSTAPYYGALGQKAYPLVMSAMAFMVVFRLNRAATCHWEARQQCGWMMIHCRDLAMTSTAALSDQPRTRDLLCEIAVAFPVAFMLHLWGSPADRERPFALMTEGVLHDEATAEEILKAAHRPLALIGHAQATLSECFRGEGRAQNAGGRAASIEATLYHELLKTAKGLGVPLGACERIQGTPLPFVYVIHMRAFLLVVLGGIPFMYACEFRWGTIPLTIVIALAYLGIEAASEECEKSFSATPSKNYHDVERFAALISDEVADMLERQHRRETKLKRP
jgi:putative membrane protein